MPADYDSSGQTEMTCRVGELGTLRVQRVSPSGQPGGEVRALTLTFIPRGARTPPRRAILTIDADGDFKIVGAADVPAGELSEILYDGLGVA